MADGKRWKLRKLTVQELKVAMYYGGLVFLGCGIAMLCAQAWSGAIPAVIGAGLVADAVL